MESVPYDMEGAEKMIKKRKLRKILLYYYEYNIPKGEIALALKLPEKTVRNIIKNNPVPLLSKYQKDNKEKACQNASPLKEKQRQAEKIKDLERIIDKYKENEQRNNQLLKNIRQRMSLFYSGGRKNWAL